MLVSVPEYHILEPSPQYNTQQDLPTHDYDILEEPNPSDNTNDLETLSVGTNIKEPYMPPSTEHHVLEGPNNEKAQGSTNEGHDFDTKPSAVDNESKQASGTTVNIYPNNRLSDAQDRGSFGLNRDSKRTLEKIFSIRRTKSLDI
jgi:hypothetical protein